MPKHDQNNTFAERLRMLRAQRQLSQEDLAARAGVQQSVIGKWERGRSAPTAPRLKRLCIVLGVSSDYLIGLSDYHSGLTPGSWVVDLGALEREDPGDRWAAEIPQKHVVVDVKEKNRLRHEYRKRSREGES